MNRFAFVTGGLLVAFTGSAAAQASTNPANPAMECLAALPAAAPLAPLLGKLELTGAPKATLEMQADTSKPSQAQKEALSRWVGLRDECFEKGMRWLETTPFSRWLRPIVTQTKDKNDALTAALYRGELTFGEFNVKAMALSAEARKRVDDGIEAARLEERTGKAPDASPTATTASRNTLQQDLYQCEQEAARSYPPNLVQRMTSPGFQAAPGATQTNCTSYGNQLSCQSGAGNAGASIYNRPPTYVTEDANLPSRKTSTRSCMVARGYTPK
ncbi:MAG: hypothetical protein HYX64_07755 [Gammaproteobacteria bacterium]|nr:hypothetical protein [Gammaproteobacteria bacterium]